MSRFVLSLIEWPADTDIGPRLLGRCEDSDLVSAVRERLANARRRDLAVLDDATRSPTAESQPDGFTDS